MTQIRPGQIQPSSSDGDVIKTVAGEAVWGSTTGTADAEFIRDTVAAALTAGTGITITVNDAGDTITIAVDTAAETERVVDALATALTAGANVTITYNDAAGTITIAAAGGGGGGGGHVIEDEGTPVTDRDNLSFVGAGVTVTDDGVDTTVVTIPGGGGSPPAWTAFDVAISQSAGGTNIAHTDDLEYLILEGVVAIVVGSIGLTAAGTSSQPIRITLPSELASRLNGNGQIALIGTARWQNTGTWHRMFHAYIVNGDTTGLIVALGEYDLFQDAGTSPTDALASGDTIALHLVIPLA